ncbi:MAG TPA: S8 family serine peptidase [Acidimicrobiales bacterium]|jgi:serine protease AprX
MRATRGISWGGNRSGGRLLAALLLVVAVLPVMPVVGATAGPLVDVIVRGAPGRGAAAEAAVGRVGGTVRARLGVVDGVAASVPASAVGRLAGAPGVVGVTPDAALQLAGDSWSGWSAKDDAGSLYNLTDAIGARSVWSRKDAAGRRLTGAGVGVALIDSGVVPVEGLTTPGRVVNGPDLSFESQAENLRYLDTFGHGTHLAGIIAGRDTGVDMTRTPKDDRFVGVAPDATLVSLKVATADGATDVSQVIAAIDWVVQHRYDDNLNIRVINLAFGTDSVQSYVLDPLAYAAEVAWRRGIVVVVSAGNDGPLAPVTDPASDPFLLTVGAADHRGTTSTSDDTVADFSSGGTDARRPDLLAPGRSVASLRNPGSLIDQAFPGGLVGDGAGRFFRGSGTSQAAAVVAGAAALLLQQRPWLTPDQVKKLLVATTDRVNGTSLGLIDVDAAASAATPSLSAARQAFPYGTGLGSLEAARGSNHVADPDDGTELTGEVDIFGQAWDPAAWASAAFDGRSWSGGDWMGRSWSGSTWSSDSWTGRSWSGRSWSGENWAGRSWSGRSWSDNEWLGRSWSGRSWSGRSWSGRSWSGRSWSTASWGT